MCAVYVNGPTPPSTNSSEPDHDRVTAVGLHSTNVLTQAIKSLVTKSAVLGWVVGEISLNYFKR